MSKSLRETLAAVSVVLVISIVTWVFVAWLDGKSEQKTLSQPETTTTSVTPSVDVSAETDGEGPKSAPSVADTPPLSPLAKRALAFEKAYLTPGMKERYEAVKPYVTDDYLATLTPTDVSAPAHDTASNTTLEFHDEKSFADGEYENDTEAHMEICVSYTARENGAYDNDVDCTLPGSAFHQVPWELIDGQWLVVVDEHR